MADGLNSVQLLGNLTAEPELRHTQAGQAVLNIRLATNESYVDKDKQRQERVEYHAVVLWGARAEGLAPHLHKGSSIFVQGGLRTTKFQDKDGNDRYKTEINATNIILCGGKRGQDASDDGGHTEPARPARNAPSGQQTRSNAAPAQGRGYGGGGGGTKQAPVAPAPVDDSEIPF